MLHLWTEKSGKHCAGSQAGSQAPEMDQIRHTHVILTQPCLIIRGRWSGKQKSCWEGYDFIKPKLTNQFIPRCVRRNYYIYTFFFSFIYFFLFAFTPVFLVSAEEGRRYCVPYKTFLSWLLPVLLLLFSSGTPFFSCILTHFGTVYMHCNRSSPPPSKYFASFYSQLINWGDCFHRCSS